MRLHALRFVFESRSGIHFPEGKSGNILRGAFGTILRQLSCVAECQSAATCVIKSRCSYAMMFEPRSSGTGPSGLHDWPRRFVFRASHLDGRTIHVGGCFHFDLHLFDLTSTGPANLILAFAQLGREGLGVGRKQVELSRVESLCDDGAVANVLYSDGRIQPQIEPAVISIPLNGSNGETRLALRFVTPTELKSESRIVSRPEFPVLTARIRDRVSTLCELYGDGAPPIDFRGFGERAAAVRITRCEIQTIQLERRSSRTGQVHSIGGFIGEVDYAGNVGEFIPWVRAACWTGVGRHTVWGKGAVEILDAS